MYKIMVIWNDASATTYEGCSRATFDAFCILSTVYAVSLYSGVNHIETNISRFAGI